MNSTFTNHVEENRTMRDFPFKSNFKPFHRTNDIIITGVGNLIGECHYSIHYCSNCKRETIQFLLWELYSQCKFECSNCETERIIDMEIQE